MSASSTIPIVVCVDVEPDARAPHPRAPSPWDGFRKSVELFSRFRLRLTSPPHPCVSWFIRMDPQIETLHGSATWIVESSTGIMATLRSAGDVFGLHTHAWRWDAPRREWVVDYTRAWVDRCLDLSFAAFHDVFGAPCTIFRFGDRWMDQATMERLADMGVQVDLTLEPGFDERSFYGTSEHVIGVLPDYRPVPRALFRPSLTDYRNSDARQTLRIWELPVTTADISPSLLRRAVTGWIRRRPVGGVSGALLSLDPARFRRIVDATLRRTSPYLVLPLRTGVCAVPRHAARVARNLEMLAGHPDAARFAWVAPQDAVRLLQA